MTLTNVSLQVLTCAPMLMAVVIWSIPAFDVTQRHDGNWEARFTETPSEDLADATAGTRKYLELICRAKRIGRALRQACDRASSPGTHHDHG